MPTALYRVASGEVVKISARNQQFADRDTTYWGVLTDPNLPNGSAVRETVDGELGPLRVLGFAKMADVGANTVRNATQQEIDTFAAAETADENAMDATQAGVLFDTHPVYRKLFVAYSDILKDEFNGVRGWLDDFKTEVAAASNLADLKTRVAGLPNMPDRTLAQLKTAIKNRMSADD